jgi:hypothetical protein
MPAELSLGCIGSLRGTGFRVMARYAVDLVVEFRADFN